MGYFKRPQFVTLIVAVLAVVLLLLLPRINEVTEEVINQPEVTFSEDYKQLAIDGLAADERKTYMEINELILSTEDPLQKIDWLDSMSRFWEQRGDLLLAGDELFQIAEIISDKASYFIAGDKYFEAFGSLTDERKAIALNKAIASYQAILALLPGDLEAMTSLGVCYVEGAAVTGEAPMKGIAMLQEVLNKDPENINALVNLGYFAAKSGQYEKAVQRFERVIEIDADFSDAYLYLSDVYMQMGNNEEAANYLEKFKRFVQDPERMEQLENYIEKIRNNKI